MSEDFKFTQFIVFLFARCLFGEFFDDFRHCNVSPSKGKCLQHSVNSSTPALSVWKLPQVLQQEETYKWTLSFYRHGPPCFKFENSTSGRARLWDTALKFLAEAFSWRHQITWLPLHENHSWQACDFTLRPFSTTWPSWNNRRTLNSTQSFILKWPFCCRSRRSFLNSLIIGMAKVIRTPRGWCSECPPRFKPLLSK